MHNQQWKSNPTPFNHKAVNSIAPSNLVEILPDAVNINKHYKLRNDDDQDQFQLELKI